jgi:hypothetical protein
MSQRRGVNHHQNRNQLCRSLASIAAARPLPALTVTRPSVSEVVVDLLQRHRDELDRWE